jgi:hypothetical protein
MFQWDLYLESPSESRTTIVILLISLSCEVRRPHVRMNIQYKGWLRDSLFDLAMHLFDVDVHSIAINRPMRLEVEAHSTSVAAQSLLIEHAFNGVNSVLMRLVPVRRRLAIILASAISGSARNSGSFSSVQNYTLRFSRLDECLFLSVTFVRISCLQSYVTATMIVESCQIQ